MSSCNGRTHLNLKGPVHHLKGKPIRPVLQKWPLRDCLDRQGNDWTDGFLRLGVSMKDPLVRRALPQGQHEVDEPSWHQMLRRIRGRLQARGGRYGRERQCVHATYASWGTRSFLDAALSGYGRGCEAHLSSRHAFGTPEPFLRRDPEGRVRSAVAVVPAAALDDLEEHRARKRPRVHLVEFRLAHAIEKNVGRLHPGKPFGRYVEPRREVGIVVRAYRQRCET